MEQIGWTFRVELLGRLRVVSWSEGGAFTIDGLIASEARDVLKKLLENTTQPAPGKSAEHPIRVERAPARQQVVIDGAKVAAAGERPVVRPKRIVEKPDPTAGGEPELEAAVQPLMGERDADQGQRVGPTDAPPAPDANAALVEQADAAVMKLGHTRLGGVTVDAGKLLDAVVPEPIVAAVERLGAQTPQVVPTAAQAAELDAAATAAREAASALNPFGGPAPAAPQAPSAPAGASAAQGGALPWGDQPAAPAPAATTAPAADAEPDDAPSDEGSDVPAELLSSVKLLPLVQHFQAQGLGGDAIFDSCMRLRTTARSLSKTADPETKIRQTLAALGIGA